MLRELFTPREARGITTANAPDSWWSDDYGVSTWSGMRVSQTSSLQMGAVYGSANLITNGISTLPTDVFRDRDGAAEEVANPPKWVGQPTGDLDFTAWCVQLILSWLFDGNVFVGVRRSPTDAVESVLPLDPAACTITREAGRKVIRVNGVIPSALSVIHVPALMWPGADRGLSPIEHARQTIGLGLSAVEYGSRHFDGDGNMPGVIESDKIMQPETKRQMAAQWRRLRSRTGKGLPGVLDDGATWKPTGVTSEQAMFLETQQWTAAAIAGQIFLVDPSELGIPVKGTSLTYANLAQRGTRLVRVTYLPWLTRLERLITGLLPRPQYFKFNVDGLLRGDLKTQFETWKIGVDSQILVPNEPRGWMDLPPLEGGDVVVKKVKKATPAPTTNDEEAQDVA